MTFPHLPVSVPCTEQKRVEALEKEKERLQKMDEEEYEALTEEEKILFNREVQQALRERKKRSESRTSPSGSNSPGSKFPWAHSLSWRWGSSFRGHQKPPGPQKDGLLRAGSILSTPGAACCSPENYSLSPLLPALAYGTRLCNVIRRGALGPSAILGLPLAPPPHPRQLSPSCGSPASVLRCPQLVTQGPLS